MRPVPGDCAFQATPAGCEEERGQDLLKEELQNSMFVRIETQLHLRKSQPKIADHIAV